MWQAKAAVQFALAHIPGGENLNYRLQELRGSYSDEAMLKELISQSSRASALAQRFPLVGASVVEIGTGWPGVGIVTLYCLGVEKIYSFDHMRHLRPNLLGRLVQVATENSALLAETLQVREHTLLSRLGELRVAGDIEQLLSLMGVDYRAPADASRTGLPDSSVDLVYSYAVLAHIPPDAILEIMRESARILKPTGIAFHRIGMQDPFAGVGGRSPVAFLRYSDRSWEFWINRSFAANNRLRAPDYAEIFANSGATVQWEQTWIDAQAVELVASMKLDERFAGLKPESLATTSMEVDLKWVDRDSLNS